MMGEKAIEISIKSSLLYLFLLLAILLYYMYLQMKVVLPNPISFGDEGFHTSLARYIAVNKEYPKYIPFEGSELVRDGFYRPPLWNLLLASFIFIFGVKEVVIKLVTLLITFFLGIATFVLVKRNFNEIFAFFTAIILVSFQSVLTYTVLFYYANLLLFWITLSLLCFITFLRENNRKFLILSSVFASLALLTNQFALTIYSLFFIYLLYELVVDRKNLNQKIKTYLPFILLLLLIPSGYIIRNILAYNTPICFSLPYLKNLFDTSGCKIDKFEEKYKFTGQAIPIGTEATAFSIGFMNYLEFAYFRPAFIILPFFIGLVLLFLSKENYTKFLLIYFLIYVILILEVGRTRAEDTARYTLGFASLFALISGFAYWKIFEFIEKKLKILKYIILILVISISFITVNERLDTLNKVKAWDPTFFEACEWIKVKTEKNATISTIWGHNGAWCSEREMGPMFADVLLSNDLNYTLKVLKENGIDYLWIQKGSIDPYNRGYAGNYPISFIRMLVDNPQYFVKVYENGDEIEKCYQLCNGQTIYKLNITDF